jgi:hypothetical protein
MNRYKSPARGEIVIGYFDPVARKYRDVSHGHNIIVYEGIDLIVKILAGQDVEMNVVYLEFTNAAVPVVVPDPAQGRSYYAALETGLTDRDYIRLSLAASPMISSTDPDIYAGNKITYFAMSQGDSTGYGGHAFTSGSQVYGIALVSAPDADDRTQDLVFSRSYDFTAKTKLAGEEISVIWSHVFGEESGSSS